MDSKVQLIKNEIWANSMGTASHLVFLTNAHWFLLFSWFIAVCKSIDDMACFLDLYILWRSDHGFEITFLLLLYSSLCGTLVYHLRKEASLVLRCYIYIYINILLCYIIGIAHANIKHISVDIFTRLCFIASLIHTINVTFNLICRCIPSSELKPTEDGVIFV